MAEKLDSRGHLEGGSGGSVTGKKETFKGMETSELLEKINKSKGKSTIDAKNSVDVVSTKSTIVTPDILNTRILHKGSDAVLSTGSISAEAEKEGRIDLTPDEVSSINAENDIEISSTEELENKCAKIVNELKDQYGVNINIDGSIPAGFLGMNRKKVLKLEETVPIFSATTKELVNLNRNIDSINNPKAGKLVKSHVDKTPPQKSAGRNALTGN
ncbi:MAG: hypothetical protein PHQ18_05045 [Patescibacteria group bacterium]|nr:hypothetical protein [Patescibacteria group bacterium]